MVAKWQFRVADHELGTPISTYFFIISSGRSRANNPDFGDRNGGKMAVPCGRSRARNPDFDVSFHPFDNMPLSPSCLGRQHASGARLPRSPTCLSPHCLCRHAASVTHMPLSPSCLGRHDASVGKLPGSSTFRRRKARVSRPSRREGGAGREAEPPGGRRGPLYAAVYGFAGTRLFAASRVTLAPHTLKIRMASEKMTPKVRDKVVRGSRQHLFTGVWGGNVCFPTNCLWAPRPPSQGCSESVSGRPATSLRWGRGVAIQVRLRQFLLPMGLRSKCASGSSCFAWEK